MSDTTIHNRPGASIVRAFRRINAAAEVIAAARAYVYLLRECAAEIREHGAGTSTKTTGGAFDRLNLAIAAYDTTEAP